MPFQPDHIAKFLDNETDSKFKSELLDLLNSRINKLCFEECQIDRIQCTLTPLCTRRFLLKLRIKNNLTIDDLPNFCYSVNKNVILRDFRNKTVVYRPYDSYLYLVDYLDVFFHGDYRKLNKFISKKDFKDAFHIFDDRINNRDEDFQYFLTDDENYIIVKYDDKLHVIFINEGYVLCNANREEIKSLELLKGLCSLFAKLYFPEISLKLIPSKFVEIVTYIPKDILSKISEKKPENEEKKQDNYLWNVFPNDLDALSQYCREISLYLDKKDNLVLKLHLNVEIPIRYKDLRLIFNIIYRLYNDFYILWV